MPIPHSRLSGGNDGEADTGSSVTFFIICHRSAEPLLPCPDIKSHVSPEQAFNKIEPMLKSITAVLAGDVIL
jgi:hypothetical protein